LILSGRRPVHHKVEKVADVLRGLPEVARRIDELDAVILQRAVAAESVQVFVVCGGRIADFFALRFTQTSKPGSVEEALRERFGRRRSTRETARSDSAGTTGGSSGTRGAMVLFKAARRRNFSSVMATGRIAG